MTVGQVILGIVMAGVVLSLISIVSFFVIGAALGLLTAITPGRRDRSQRLKALSHGCDVTDLAEIDRRLDRILAEEGSGLPTWGHAA